MRSFHQSAISLAAFLCIVAGGVAAAEADQVLLFRMQIADIVDDFKVTLFDDTPQARDNFLAYVRDNRLDNTIIHRKATVQNSGVDVLQGGGFGFDGQQAIPVDTFDPINDDSEAIHSNTRGTIAMAENAEGFTSQWFVNINDNTALDGDFTVFGEVTANMALVDAIWNLPAADGTAFHPAWTNVPVLSREDGNFPAFNFDILELPTPGDMNGDGVVDIDDVDPFILALEDPQGFFDTFGREGWWTGDLNNDRVLNNFDIAPFRDLIPGGDSLIIPEPTTGMLAVLGVTGVLGWRRRRG